VQCSPASSSTLDNEKNITNLLIRTRGGQNGDETVMNYKRVNGSMDVEKGETASEKRLTIAEETLQTWRLCPVPNSHAILALAGVLIYSGTFLIYAQNHSIVLLIMTGLIAICIVCLYTSGVLCILYMMLKIDEMECGHTMCDKSKPSVSSICSTCTQDDFISRESSTYLGLHVSRIRPVDSRAHLIPPFSTLPHSGATRIVIFNTLDHDRREERAKKEGGDEAVAGMKF